jgi:hypothetical protein
MAARTARSRRLDRVAEEDAGALIAPAVGKDGRSFITPTVRKW